MSKKLLAVGALLLLTSVPLQAQEMGRLPNDGSELFRFALHMKGLKPLSEREWFDTPPPSSNLLIVVVGDTSLLDRYFPRNRPGLDIDDLLKNGGAVLILSDTSNLNPGRGGGTAWGFKFSVHLSGRRLQAAPDAGYEGDRSNPFVKPRQRVQVGSPSPFDLFDGVEVGGAKGVATNRPSELITPGNRRYLHKELAGYAEGTRYENGQLVKDAKFAVSVQPNDQFGQPGPGRMIVLADKDVFSNEMMAITLNEQRTGVEFKNGNWEFANRTIDWLQGGFRGQTRTQCLFIENGQIVDKFAKELPQEPKPPIPDIPPNVLANWILRTSNAIIPWAEENNLFNRILERYLGFPRLVRIFLIIVTIVFIIAALRWLARGLRKAEPTSTLRKDVQAGMLPRGGVLRQRTAAQIEVGNLYEAARRRVRSRFDVLGARPGASGQMPPILTANDLSDGPLLHQTIRWLWAVGYGETPLTVTTGEWDRLNSLLERVTARAARGDWSFGQEA